MKSKKGVIGIGTLIIFIATLVVSMIAAGVLVTATGILQERALLVEETVRERLTTGIEVFQVFAVTDPDNNTMTGIELFTRLRPGSNPVQMATTNLAIDSPFESYSAQLNTSLIGTSGECDFNGNMTGETYCMDVRFGNTNSVLEDGELVVIRYAFPEDRPVVSNTPFSVIITPRIGGLEILELRAPDIILEQRVRLR